MNNPVFKEEMTWRGYRFRLEVFDDNDFSKLKDIQQVYGFLFNEKDEIMILREGPDKQWQLPGGTPENYDKTWKDTLIREAEEEVDVELEDIRPAGYIRSTALDKNSPQEAKVGIMLRTVAKITKIKPQTIDPDTGILNERKLIPVKDFLKYFHWGENGRLQLEMAMRAKEERKG
jgi:8-oxo-dGTP pyrophosphatase MutT (NUDIX family)